MYKDSFYKVDPGSLKEIEFKSFRKLEKTSNFRINSVLGKAHKSNSFLRNHISLTPGTKIVELPMSPFGKHTSYNEEADFKKKHFLGAGSAENKNVEKQIKLLKKRINNNLKNAIGKKSGIFRTHQDMFEFKTNGGKLFSDVVRMGYFGDKGYTRVMSEERECGKIAQSSTMKSLKSLGKNSILSIWKDD